MPLCTFIQKENGENEVRYGKIHLAGNPEIVKKRELNITKEEYEYIKTRTMDEVKDIIDYFLTL